MSVASFGLAEAYVMRKIHKEKLKQIEEERSTYSGGKSGAKKSGGGLFKCAKGSPSLSMKFLIKHMSYVKIPGCGFSPAREEYIRASAFGHRKCILEGTWRLKNPKGEIEEEKATSLGGKSGAKQSGGGLFKAVSKIHPNNTQDTGTDSAVAKQAGSG
ncbi:hypothetical protein FEM48_Zijuj06G0120200 [Ziziphus jujuba var. spinosa]|uniref:Uncharacterized protein n=1 Tax=Ziziphus jujuba var. spinosa TaxID=714518 RepID=A0A978V963_ZIZJJ|nr:hypothetical protein FEM48_Zijuj06G0120200 [Ziziphus jujuba var. spinosa]